MTKQDTDVERRYVAPATLRTVLDDIVSERIHSCYLLYGDEEYLVDDALRQIVEAILPGDEKHLNLFWMDGEGSDREAIYESLLTPPLIAGKKVVAVKNTNFFYSKESLPHLVTEVEKNMDTNPTKAAHAFVRFLQTAGWSLEELRDDGWKKISAHEWRKVTGDDSHADREHWLPKVIDTCVSLGLTTREKGSQADRLEEVLRGGLPHGNCLILTADVVDKRKRNFKVISEVGAVLHFPKTKGEDRQRTQFLHAARDVLHREGKQFSSDALRALGEKTGFHLRESMGELEKVITYVGDKGFIEEGDIRVIAGKTKEDSVFDLTSAIVAKDATTALSTIHDLLDHGTHYLMIIAILAREVRLLLQGKMLLASGLLISFRRGMGFNEFKKVVYPVMKSIEADERTRKKLLVGQHPYVIYTAVKNSERFSFHELVSYMDRLASADSAVKTTGKDPTLLLERLAIEMCQ